MWPSCFVTWCQNITRGIASCDSNIASRKVYEFPDHATLNGINFQKNLQSVVFEQRLDDTRLRSDEVLVATYPRTGKLVSIFQQTYACTGPEMEGYIS